MRPLYLKFGAFGPYKDVQEIDFAQLWDKGLFLICGETGSGKTMILDAMTFALYGKSSGNMRDELEALRCRQSDWGQDTFVEFTFEIQGLCYRFERRLTCKRKNLSTSQNAYRQNEEGVFEPVFENCKKGDMDNLAKELIGLDYDQFRQVIVLPQGQFEKLLTSGSEEKEKILMRIFGVDKWQKLAEHFYRHAEERFGKLKELREDMLRSLGEEECGSLAEFRDQIELLEQQLAELEQEYAGLGYEERRKALEQEKERGSAFTRMRNVEAELQKLEQDRDRQQERMERRRLSQQAQSLRPLFQRIEVLEADRKRRGVQVENQKRELIGAREALEQCRKQLQELGNRWEEMTQLSQELPVYRQKRSSYVKLNELQSSLGAQERILAEAGEELERKNILWVKGEEQSKRLKDDFEQISKEHRRLLHLYMANIAGILARDLQEGEPCPVCGSREHPSVAVAEAEQVTRERVEAQKQLEDDTYRQLSEALEAAAEAKEQCSRQERYLSQQQQQRKVLEQELVQTKGQLISGVVDLSSYEAWLADKERQINDYEKQHLQLQEDLSARGEALAVSKSNYDNAGKELEAVNVQLQEQQRLLQQKLEELGFDTREEAKTALLSEEQQEKLHQEIEKYVAARELLQKQLEEMGEMLQGQQEPDMVLCQQQLQGLEQQKEDFITRREALRVNLQRKQNKEKRLRQGYEELEMQWTGAETDWVFAKTLRGDTGTGLQRYVLGILFSSVIVAANAMLEQVHGGRYRLYRSDERTKGSNKRGLELKVHDSFSSAQEGRSVKTLSGGEKFLVSLALSIGVSTVARKSGIRIEAMFIDEGFGSLDNNSIEDALSILAGIQRSKGMVGIISHVQLLQDHIPAKLQIQKSRDGSEIVSNIG